VKILAIDPGTKCGYAVREANGDILVAGTWDLKPQRHEGGGMRFLRLRRYIAEILETSKPHVVVYEEVRRHLGTDAGQIYGGIVGTLTSLCEENDLPYKGIPVGTIKIEATGKGNSSKDKMIAAANERWGLELTKKDENEADARWIAETAWKQLGDDYS
jgi:Holliday junction resolvasome RuvABC endonuclease subunit